MFNKKVKEDIMFIKAKIELLDDSIYGKSVYNHINKNWESVIGLKEKILNLELENKKLKAIVAELCDYVYSKGVR